MVDDDELLTVPVIITVEPDVYVEAGMDAIPLHVTSLSRYEQAPTPVVPEYPPASDLAPLGPPTTMLLFPLGAGLLKTTNIVSLVGFAEYDVPYPVVYTGKYRQFEVLEYVAPVYPERTVALYPFPDLSAHTLTVVPELNVILC